MNNVSNFTFNVNYLSLSDWNRRGRGLRDHIHRVHLLHCRRKRKIEREKEKKYLNNFFCPRAG